jgi:acyl dehydratase
MTSRLEALLATEVPDARQTFTKKDAILYALGVGVGADPQSQTDLQFVYEKHLVALPTFPVVLGATRVRDLGLGLDYLKLVHGEQSMTLHRAPPVEGTVVTRTRVLGVMDKGRDKGAVVVLRRQVADDVDGLPIATLDMTLFARGDGGIGSSITEVPAPRCIPDRSPDAVLQLKTLAQSALIYRLSGDLNPLHADPEVARAAGFERPILHGLATYGAVGYAAVTRMCDGDATRVHSLTGRFSGPVFPGETLAIEFWREGDGAAIRARVLERDAVVFNNGHAALANV